MNEVPATADFAEEFILKEMPPDAEHRVRQRLFDMTPGRYDATAWVNRDGFHVHQLMRGYRAAADTLVAQIDRDEVLADLVLYPIVQLYRHHLELALKAVAVAWRRIDSEQGTLDGHDLRLLWDQAKSILATDLPSKFESIHSAITERISELSSIDPTGQTFRYRLTRHGRASDQDHLAHVEQINLDRFRAVFAVVSDYLMARLALLASKADILESPQDEPSPPQ